MASALKEIFNTIEKGRQNCIKNAKIAGLDVNENMDIYSLGDLFLQQNNKEDLDNDEWQLPSDWWDGKNILLNAEERNGYKPAYLVLYDDSLDTQTFYYSKSSQAYYHHAILTSDGAWYEGKKDVTHTWDRTKDKPCSKGYKTRYIIVYYSNFMSDVRLTNEKLLAIWWSYANLKSSVVSQNKYIQYIEASPTEENMGMLTIASYCFSLKKVVLNTIKTISSAKHFQGCSSLEVVELPKLEYIKDKATDLFSGCYRLKRIYAPLLKQAETKFLDGGSYRLKADLPSLEVANNLNSSPLVRAIFPNLTTVTTTGFNSTMQLSYAYLPKLKACKTAMFNGCYALRGVYMPSIEKIEKNAFLTCYSLEEIEFPSTLKEADFTNCFQACYSLRNVKLFNDWNLSGLNLTDCPLSKECMLDMLDKIKDVSTEETTYTLTLGNNNLANLTTEEKAIAINKGWTLS